MIPGGTLNIAHRGASAYLPENTIAAFELALQMGADGIETDVRGCGDGTLVCLHDPTLDRVASGPVAGMPPVRRSTIDELRRIDVGRHPGENGAIPYRIPELVDVLARFGQRTKLFLDLKRDAGEVCAADRLAEALRAIPPRHVRVLSFCSLSLGRLRRRAPDVPLVAVHSEESEFAAGYRLMADAHLCRGSAFPVSAIGTVLVDHARALGMELYAYGGEAYDQLVRCYDLGISGVITDHPDRARRAAHVLDPEDMFAGSS